jgi:hypothetical protein
MSHLRAGSEAFGRNSAADVAGLGRNAARVGSPWICRVRRLPSRRMSALPERRTPPTIRCLRDDLGLALPTIDVDLGTLDHPLTTRPGGLPRLRPRARSGSWRSSIRSSTGSGTGDGAARSGSRRQSPGSGCSLVRNVRRARATTPTKCSLRSTKPGRSWLQRASGEPCRRGSAARAGVRGRVQRRFRVAGRPGRSEAALRAADGQWAPRAQRSLGAFRRSRRRAGPCQRGPEHPGRGPSIRRAG